MRPHWVWCHVWSLIQTCTQSWCSCARCRSFQWRTVLRHLSIITSIYIFIHCAAVAPKRTRQTSVPARLIRYPCSFLRRSDLLKLLSFMRLPASWFNWMFTSCQLGFHRNMWSDEKHRITLNFLWSVTKTKNVFMKLWVGCLPISDHINPNNFIKKEKSFFVEVIKHDEQREKSAAVQINTTLLSSPYFISLIPCFRE